MNAWLYIIYCLRFFYTKDGIIFIMMLVDWNYNLRKIKFILVCWFNYLLCICCSEPKKEKKRKREHSNFDDVEGLYEKRSKDAPEKEVKMKDLLPFKSKDKGIIHRTMEVKVASGMYVQLKMMSFHVMHILSTRFLHKTSQKIQFQDIEQNHYERHWYITTNFDFDIFISY